jgi:hypothetical protein
MPPIPMMKELFKAPHPVPVKDALQIKGLDAGTVAALTEKDCTKWHQKNATGCTC